jgi:hypothetical protein
MPPRYTIAGEMVILALCMVIAGVVMADGTVVEQEAVKLYRGAAIIAASDPNHRTYRPNFTPAACRTLKTERVDAEKAAKTSGPKVQYKCQIEERSIISFRAAPVQTCGAKPADEQRPQTCPPGTSGTWLQDRVWTLQPYPTCWTQGNWTPSSPSAGMCAPVPPPTCAAAPADRLIDCPTGYTGTWTQRAEVGPPPACAIAWSPIAWPPTACTIVSQPPADRPLFIDRFEYDVSRSATNAEQLFAGSGWSGVKAENSNFGRGDGWAYTRTDATLGSKVLVLESRPTDSPPPAGFPYQQTDYWIQRGNESGSGVAIPANAWIQFWTYATPESRFSTRDKTIYPCRGAYPCHPTWLFMWGASGFEDSAAPAGGRYLALEGEGAIRDTRNTGDGNSRKLFQNASKTPLIAGRWYQVRLHIDISGTQGVYEAWIKERGQSGFTKIADWRGGVTANFSWPLPTSQRGAYSVVRIPTTVNAQNNTVYIDDFVIAGSQEALPN